MEKYAKIREAIENGQYKDAEEQTKIILEEGESASSIIGFITGTLNDVGKSFSAGEIYIPEMMVSAKAAQRAIDVLKPYLLQTGVEPIGRVVIGTVTGDLHDLGKNIVTLMLRGAGFDVKDLGIDVSPETFVETIKSFKPHVVALSCLISTTMKSIPITIDAIKEAGLDSKTKIMVGGPPTTEEFAKKVGADFWGKDAQIGVEIAKSIVLS